MFLNKEPCANRISLRVETRIVLLNEEHLINETVKFPWHFFRMWNWLSLRRLVSPWAVKKCSSIAEFLCLNNNTLM